MSHCNTVIDGYRVELSSIAAEAFYLALHDLSGLVQMCVTWNKLCKAIDDGNNGFAKLFTLHTVGYPQGAGSGHSATFCADSTTKLVFHINMHFLG